MAIEISYITPIKIPTGYRLSFQRSRRYDNGFPQGLTVDQSIKYLEEEIWAFGAQSATIYSFYERLNVPRLRRANEEDSAISVKVGLNTRNYHFICDRWYLLEHNLYALHLSLRALKNIEKWGVGDLTTILKPFDVSYETVVKEGDSRINEWMHTLGLGPTATIEDANAIYRNRAKLAADNQDELLKLNQAIEDARKALS